MVSLGKRALLFVGVHILGLVLLALTVFAQEDGALLSLHDLRVERGRLCIVDHFHVGNSSSQPTKKLAEREAIASWAGFTAWEYGDHWGNFKVAANRSMQCNQAGGKWSCETQARPCRSVGRRAVRKGAKSRASRRNKR